MTVVVTGGGTGGHIYPAVAVAEALSDASDGIIVEYIGAVNGRERDIAVENGLRFVGVPARKIRRLASPDTLVSLLTLYKGYRQARAHMRANRPGVVLGTGGYVAAAATLAAAALGVPTVIHEQNAVAGRTNRWLARRAATVCVTYGASAPEFAGARVVVTGLPLRSALRSSHDRALSRSRFGIAERAFTLLVLGGSQGAAALNEVVTESLGSFDEGVAIIHQTGAGAVPSGSGPGSRIPSGVRCSYTPLPYLGTDDLLAAYGSADLVLCRCGASTLAEVAMAALPALLVPYPLAYADHQTANAQVVADAGAGTLILQTQLTPERLLSEISNLRADRGRLDAMSAASGRLARPDAARAVAEEVLRCAERNVRGVT